MNVILKTKPGNDATAILHGIMGYDRASDELVSERHIPAVLDTVALRIARVPTYDMNGALSYPLNTAQVAAFGLLLGLETDTCDAEFFLEAVTGSVAAFSPAEREAIETIAALSSRSVAKRPRWLSEGDLVVPVLCLLDQGDCGWLALDDLATRLARLLPAPDADAGRVDRQHEADVSKKVRDMVAHRNRETSFIGRGFAECGASPRALRITGRGRALVHALRTRGTASNHLG